MNFDHSHNCRTKSYHHKCPITICIANNNFNIIDFVTYGVNMASGMRAKRAHQLVVPRLPQWRTQRVDRALRPPRSLLGGNVCKIEGNKREKERGRQKEKGNKEGEGKRGEKREEKRGKGRKEGRHGKRRKYKARGRKVKS